MKRRYRYPRGYRTRYPRQYRAARSWRAVRNRNRHMREDADLLARCLELIVGLVQDYIDGLAQG